MKIASGKKWIAALVAVLMMCVCAFACAQSYRLGDEAEGIAIIQTALKQLKYYNGEITGHYGAKTQSAVQSFQRDNNLRADGIAGEDTIDKLYLKAGITTDGVSASASSASDSSLLRHGSRSEAVRQMQEDLKKLGYYSGTVSGHYGTLTEAAVTSFQKDNGLSADGIAGSKTLAKIASKRSSGSSSSASSSSSSTSSSSVLKYGVKNDAVRSKATQNISHVVRKM